MAAHAMNTSRNCMRKLVTVGSVLKTGQTPNVRMESTSSTAGEIQYQYETLSVTRPTQNIVHVEMNRPTKRNALNEALWREIRECFFKLGEDPDCRAVVLSGSGQMFTAGIDLTMLSGMANLVTGPEDVARKAIALKRVVGQYQNTFTAIEKCPKPVIAAIHNACIGAGVDMVSACDIRYCTKDAWFQIKEVEMGLAADVGTLQRFPKIVGNDSLARELAYTARKFYADEAYQVGFISRVLSDKDTMMSTALETAAHIASKSPVAVQGTKIHLNYSRDHSVQEGLDFMTHWNMTMLQSEDVMKSVMAAMDKSVPQYSKL